VPTVITVEVDMKGSVNGVYGDVHGCLICGLLFCFIYLSPLITRAVSRKSYDVMLELSS
jgi:hypothetical protein